MTTLLCSGVLSLNRPAKKAGGDAYHGTLKCSEAKVVSEINIYVPQEISRCPSNPPSSRLMAKPHDKLMVKICVHDETDDLVLSPGEGENIVQVKLVQAAKSSGGDKYEGNLSNGAKFTPYVPQCFSRMSKPERHKRLVIAFKQYDRKKREAERIMRAEERNKKKKATRIVIDEDDDEISCPAVKLEVHDSTELGVDNLDDNLHIDSSSSSGTCVDYRRNEGGDDEEIRRHYETAYTEEARRINSVKMGFDALKEAIAANNLHILGRNFEQHREYKIFMDNIKCGWSSASDFILAEKIGLPFCIGTDGKKTVIRSEIVTDPRYTGKLFLLENDFPYNFESNMKHFCLWKIGGKINVGGDDCEIRGEMARIGYPSSQLNDTWCYYINPPNLKSILDLDHAHIIIRINVNDPTNRIDKY